MFARRKSSGVSFSWCNSVLLLSILFLVIPRCHGIFVGGAFLPHGDFAYDPSLADNSLAYHAAQRIAQAAHKAGAWLIDQLHPETIVLITPHGYRLDHDFAIFVGRQGYGQVTIGNDLYNTSHHTPYNLSALYRLGRNESKSLLKNLHYERLNVSGLYPPNEDTPLPLQWGEIIPLSFLPKVPELIVISQPFRRYTDEISMIPELMAVGSALRRWMDGQHANRIAVLLSGDLSHTHDPMGPYGYSNSSTLFDRMVGGWWRYHGVQNCGESYQRMQQLAWLEPAALSCGFTGLMMLQGMLCSVDDYVEVKNDKVYASVLANLNVTYYGMMAATIKIVQNEAMKQD